MALFRLARYTVRPEEIARCIAATEAIVADVTAHEPGTIQYTVLQEAANPANFVHCSAYVDEAARDRHLSNPMMLDRIATVLQPAMTAPPQFQEYTSLSSKPTLSSGIGDEAG